jgi:hypothetical protein
MGWMVQAGARDGESVSASSDHSGLVLFASCMRVSTRLPDYQCKDYLHRCMNKHATL